jgi:hypothetical protein
MYVKPIIIVFLIILIIILVKKKNENMTSTEATNIFLSYIDNQIDLRTKLSYDNINGWNTTSNIININCISFPEHVGPMIGGYSRQEHVNPLEINAAQKFRITNTGTYFKSVYLEGLGEDGIPQSEILELEQNTTNDTLTDTINSYIHINRMIPISIDISITSNAEIFCRRITDNRSYATASRNITASGWFRCPAGYKAILIGLAVTSEFRSNIAVIHWTESAYNVAFRDDNVTNLNINHPLLVINSNDSVYLYQYTNANAKGTMTFMLIKN